MSEDKEAYSEHVSGNHAAAGHSTPANPKGHLRRHCARFWWLWLLILVIIVLIVVLPIIYVGYPHMAQSAVNKSTVNVTSMSILNTAPDSFDLDLVSVIGSKSSYHPHLDAFNASVSMQDSSTSFMTVEIPAVQAENGATTSIKNQHITISDLKAFTEYATAILQNETVTIALKGKTGLKQGSLPKTTVDYNHEVHMTGFNSIPDLSIPSAKVLSKALDDGTNLLTNISLPNPTVQTIELGTLALNLSVALSNSTSKETIPVGTGIISNAVLHPGPNLLVMRGITNQAAVYGIIVKHPEVVSALPIQINTLNSTGADGELIPYLTQALASTPLFVKLNLTQALGG